MIVLAVITAGLAGVLAIPPSAAQLSRLGQSTPAGLPWWLAGRPGGLPMRSRLVIGLVLCVLVILVLPGLPGIGCGVLIGGLGVLLSGCLESGTSRKHNRRLIREQPLALTFIAATLRAGAPLRVAVSAVARVSPPDTAGFLDAISARIAVGATDEEAWSAIRGDKVWGEIARDVARAASNGTTLVNVLESHATEARGKAFSLRQSAARRVGVKVALPLMCCFLPAFLCIGVIPIVASLLGRYIGW